MNNSMTLLLSSWFNSLKVLSPTHGKLFLLVTLKAIIHTYRVLIKKFWWLIILCIIVDTSLVLWANKLPHYRWFNVKISAMVAGWYLSNSLFFIEILITRPSLAKKDANYFFSFSNGRYFFYFLLFMFIAQASVFFLRNEKTAHEFIVPSLLFFLPFIPSILFAGFFIITIFFALDTHPTFYCQVSSLYRALKMILFNYPFFLILAILSFSVFFGIQKLIYFVLGHVISNYEIGILGLVSYESAQLLMPIFICIANNFYIKEIHEQFKRYY